MSKKALLTVFALTLVALVVVSGGVYAKTDVIRLWTYPVYHGYDVELQGLVEQFEAEHPDIDVEYEILSWLEGPQKFEVALNAGNPPDVFWGNPQPKYVQTGLVVSLDDHFSSEDYSAYDKNLLDGYVIEGELRGIPLYAGIWALGGNKALLEEAGIDWRTVQVEGWTWDEFFEVAKKLTKPLTDGSKQWGFLMPGYNSELLEFLMLNNHANQIVSSDGTLKWNEDRVLEAFTLIRKLMDEGVMPKEASGMASATSWEMFNNWEVAIQGRGIPYYDVMSRDRAADIASGKKEGRPIEYVCLPIPHNQGAPQGVIVRVNGYSVFRQKRYQGDQHTANAIKLAKYLTSHVAAGAAIELACLPSSLKGQEVFDREVRIEDYNNDFFKRQVAQINWPAMPMKYSTAEARIRSEVILPTFQGVMAYEMTPEEAAKTLIDRANRILR